MSWKGRTCIAVFFRREFSAWGRGDPVSEGGDLTFEMSVLGWYLGMITRSLYFGRHWMIWFWLFEENGMRIVWSMDLKKEQVLAFVLRARNFKWYICIVSLLVPEFNWSRGLHRWIIRVVYHYWISHACRTLRDQRNVGLYLLSNLPIVAVMEANHMCTSGEMDTWSRLEAKKFVTGRSLVCRAAFNQDSDFGMMSMTSPLWKLHNLEKKKKSSLSLNDGPNDEQNISQRKNWEVMLLSCRLLTGSRLAI